MKILIVSLACAASSLTLATSGSALDLRWDSFHGQPNGQKYSPLTDITIENVDALEKAWEVHTGDMSDGSGDLPETVWSATPIFANDTLNRPGDTMWPTPCPNSVDIEPAWRLAGPNKKSRACRK